MSFVPARGDVVVSGRRPALVLSPAGYNEKTGLALVCPLSSRAKGYPFEVALPPGLKAQGVVLADHVKSQDWKARKARFLCRAPASVMDEVLAKLEPLLRP